MSKELIVKCPICKALVKRENETFPFCSARCKTIDLGHWASGGYAIPDADAEMNDFDYNHDGDDSDKGTH